MKWIHLQWAFSSLRSILGHPAWGEIQVEWVTHHLSQASCPALTTHREPWQGLVKALDSSPFSQNLRCQIQKQNRVSLVQLGTRSITHYCLHKCFSNICKTSLSPHYHGHMHLWNAMNSLVVRCNSGKDLQNTSSCFVVIRFSRPKITIGTHRAGEKRKVLQKSILLFTECVHRWLI